jgi:mono/diheme cytochrome c family protein
VTQALCNHQARWVILCYALMVASTSMAPAYAASLTDRLGARDGRTLFKAACAACHGPNGEGTPQSVAGFDRPQTFPDFSACDQSAPEETRNWKAVIRDGGPARGFAQIMPAFGDVLTAVQIDQLVVHLRSLCKEKGWALGELNVPRALVTEKAFPESETVLTTSISAQGAPGINGELAYERILGKRDQLEVAIPFGWIHKENGGLVGGIGDIALALKHVAFAKLDNPEVQPDNSTGSILSFQAEIALATGNEARGLGSGETTFGLAAAYDRLLPAQWFLQLQLGADLPLHPEHVPRSGYLRTALGRSFSGMSEARLWTPMLELLGERDLVSGAGTHWAALPEFQVTLNRRQHVRAALGYRVPLNDTAERAREVIFYFMWDWFDGGLTEGW